MCQNDRTGTCLGLEFYHPTTEKGTPIKSLKWLEHHHSSMEKLFALRRPDTQLKPHLLLVSFYSVSAQFHINRDVFLRICYICSILYTNCSNVFRFCFADLKKSSHMPIIRFSTALQVANNRSTQTIDDILNLH